MKFLAISDQHLGHKLYNFPELEDDSRQLFSQVIDMAIDLKVNYLVSVGDLFDNNRPTSELIDFVSFELGRLKDAGITPVGIAGDHSKPLDGVTWEKICGFKPINIVPEFVGIDYNDNPQQTLNLLNVELNSRPKDSVNFIFLHQQIPELWPFCDDKKIIALKDIDFSNHCSSLKAVFLGDIHKRKEMWYKDPVCNSKVFIGYCGSLGVTASDETEKEGIYLWEDNALKTVEYSLVREFVILDIDKDSIETFVKSDFDKYAGLKNRPVFICRYKTEVSGSLNKLNFLYDLGIVKFTKLKTDKDVADEYINIRSELKTSDRISSVLKNMTTGKKEAELLYDYSHKLLFDEDPSRVLDQLKLTLLK
jgi:DNA repair exonuclease SbcCD nuclease subunit